MHTFVNIVVRLITVTIMFHNFYVSVEFARKHARCRIGHLHSVLMSNFSSEMHVNAELVVAVVASPSIRLSLPFIC